MGKLLVLLLLLVILVSCFSAGETDRGFHIGRTEGKPSGSEPNGSGSGLCLCPGSQRPQKLKKHGLWCPCDGVTVLQSGRHRRHSHHRNKHRHHRRHKCREFQTNCQHRLLMTGLQIPL